MPGTDFNIGGVEGQIKELNDHIENTSNIVSLGYYTDTWTTNETEKTLLEDARYFNLIHIGVMHNDTGLEVAGITIPMIQLRYWKSVSVSFFNDTNSLNNRYQFRFSQNGDKVYIKYNFGYGGYAIQIYGYDRLDSAYPWNF